MLRDSGKDTEMVEKILKKAMELLEAYGRQEMNMDVQSLSRDEIDSVVGGAPETFNLSGRVLTRSEVNDYLKDVYDYFGADIAERVLINKILPGMGYYNYNYSKDRILYYFRMHGIGDEFWTAMDERRPGSTYKGW